MKFSAQDKTLYKYIDNIVKTSDELNNIPIPELYDIPISSFENNFYHQSYGFGGINGLEVITPKQTVCSAYPLINRIIHNMLYSSIIYRIESDNKAKWCLDKFTRNKFDLLFSCTNQIILRSINRLTINDDKIESENICIVYGDINNINSYQKEILIKSLEAMYKKDPTIELYNYNAQNRLFVKDVVDVVPNENVFQDSDEKIISIDKMTNISKYNINDDNKCFYEYKNDIIQPISKFDGYEEMLNYFDKVLTPSKLNTLLIKGTKMYGYKIAADQFLIPEQSKRAVG